VLKNKTGSGKYSAPVSVIRLDSGKTGRF